MKQSLNASGHAALAICESLILSLTERAVIDASEAKAVLSDAASAHRNAMPDAPDPAVHAAAAEIIEIIIKRRNSIHHI